MASTVSEERPDNDGELSTGENAWGYVRGLAMKSYPRTPIFFDSSAEAGTFHAGVWNGRAIVAKIDGSVVAMEIDYGGGSPLNDDGSFKLGPIIETRGMEKVDIFKDLPEGAVVLVPGMKSKRLEASSTARKSPVQ